MVPSNGECEVTSRLKRKLAFGIALFSLALSVGVITQPIQGQPDANGNRKSGSRTHSHTSDKGTEAGNAHWYADPERGWVRAEKRHELQKKGKQPAKKHSEYSRQKGVQGSIG